MMSRGDGGGNAGRNHNNGPRTHRMSKADRDNRSNQLNPNNEAYRSSRSGGSASKGSGMDDARAWMDQEAARRIQSHADETGRNQDFKGRAQSAADRNEKDE